jgi:hypothetical protein
VQKKNVLKFVSEIPSLDSTTLNVKWSMKRITIQSSDELPAESVQNMLYALSLKKTARLLLSH